ncbi:MAG: undecaprenyl-diphosphatase UppP [Clostridia bacterium]|nr:undecaprenyl-diphosphatase UppP [Clostridia bacterium]
MDEIIQAVILAIVQGLTELLPISSSAHLFLIPWFFNWETISPSFDVALHAGTLLAISVFFFKDWINLFIGGYKLAVKKEKTTDGKMFWYLVAATIPGALIGYLFDKFVGESMNIPIIIGIALIIMGILLYIIDKYCINKTTYENITFKQSFLIGFSQALAFIPGVSRSGVTMTVARFMGVNREAAAKFSFMLSTPIVFAAVVLQIKDFVFGWPLIIGILVSFIFGLIVIKFLLEFLKKGSFKIFAVYRVILGIVVIAVALFIK